MAALTALTASATPAKPSASSTALCTADRLSSTSSANWSSDSLACSPASVSGVPSPLTSSMKSFVALSRSSTASLTESSFRFPSLSEAAVDEIDSLQDVIAEQTSPAHSVAELSPPSSPPQPLAKKAASSATTSQAIQRTIVSERPSYPRAFALIASYSAWVMAPESSSPLAFSISPAGPAEPAVVRT